MLLQPNKKNAKKLRDALQDLYKHLDSSANVIDVSQASVAQLTKKQFLQGFFCKCVFPIKMEHICNKMKNTANYPLFFCQLWGPLINLVRKLAFV